MYSTVCKQRNMGAPVQADTGPDSGRCSGFGILAMSFFKSYFVCIGVLPIFMLECEGVKSWRNRQL